MEESHGLVASNFLLGGSVEGRLVGQPLAGNIVCRVGQKQKRVSVLQSLEMETETHFRCKPGPGGHGGRLSCRPWFLVSGRQSGVWWMPILPERSFLLTRKRWWEICHCWRYILVGGIFLLVVYFRSVAELQLLARANLWQLSFQCHKLIVALCTTISFTIEYNYIKLPLNPGPQALSIIRYHL